MADETAKLEVSTAPGKGNGLFATKALMPGEEIFEESRPFLAVLDSTKLKEACAWCFNHVGETKDPNLKLKVCTGCQILRFCNTNCQSAAWKHSHKLECKIYRGLYPSVLPNTARMVVQLLVRRKAGTISKDDLEAFGRLRHHYDDFQKSASAENSNFENLSLMARAAQEYSGTNDDLAIVQTAAARILINTMTLVTHLFTPIGLALSVRSALLNHSCAPNTVHVFSGGRITLRAATRISAGTELTTSYIDRSFPPAIRQAELKGRWFFDCTCTACSANETLDRSDPPPAFSSLSEADQKALFDLEDAAAELLMGSQGEQPDIALPRLTRALTKFSNSPATKIHYPAWRQPLAKTRTELMLALLGFRRWVPSLLLHLVQYISSDPVTFPNEKHPVRVAHAWVLARLVAEVGARAHGEAGADEDDKGENEAARAFAERFQIDWGVLLWLFVSDVATRAKESHGPKNRLSVEAGDELSKLSDEMRSMGGQPPTADVLKPVKERLELIVKEGWNWWREWERKRIQSSGKLVQRDSNTKGEEQAMELLYLDDPE